MIKEFFQSFNIFSDHEIDDFVQLFEMRIMYKNDYFVKEGGRCNEIAFVESGIIRSYYTSFEGDDITYCFRFPNDLMAAYSSFITGNGSMETMQAISQAKIWVVNKVEIENLIHKSYNWTKFLKIIAEQQYLELEKRVFQLQKNSALQRYITLLENQPQYIQHIPLQYLASYLGITQRHLSRIRKEISF